MEDAFLEAILDTPADAGPRLVYADWLEERGDPRSQYLRAEVELVRAAADERPKIAARLAELAGGLDPVWRARLSRPPIGVCCDRIRFTTFGDSRPLPRLNPAAFQLLESWLGTDLPPTYRAFLLNYNGGTPEPGRLVLAGDVHREVQYLLSSFSAQGQSEDCDLDLLMLAENHLVGAPPLMSAGIGIPEDCIKIGVFTMTDDCDTLCLGFRGAHRGQVLSVVPAFLPNEEPIVTPVARSFSEFLDMLH